MQLTPLGSSHGSKSRIPTRPSWKAGLAGVFPPTLTYELVNAFFKYISQLNFLYHSTVTQKCTRGTKAISNHFQRRCCISLEVPKGTPCRVTVYHEGIIGSFVEKQRQSRRDHYYFKRQNTGCSILDELPASTRNKGNDGNCKWKCQETR